MALFLQADDVTHYRKGMLHKQMLLHCHKQSIDVAQAEMFLHCHKQSIDVAWAEMFLHFHKQSVDVAQANDHVAHFYKHIDDAL